MILDGFTAVGMEILQWLRKVDMFIRFMMQRGNACIETDLLVCDFRILIQNNKFLGTKWEKFTRQYLLTVSFSKSYIPSPSRMVE